MKPHRVGYAVWLGLLRAGGAVLCVPLASVLETGICKSLDADDDTATHHHNEARVEQ